VADPRDLEPDDGSIWIEYELWYRERTRERGGLFRRREVERERGHKLAFRGRVRVPPGDYDAMLDAFDRVFDFALDDSHYAALTAAIEEDGERRGIGPAVRQWAREIAVVLAADQAAALVPSVLKIVAAFLGIHH